ncbi:sensor histidine kinase [Streptomyces rubradiris]|uniref:histidine kinase n=1 Tax=Streptomyces rubradiris TaxID=285531 RepID=A0ABQ3RA78_STRRR|nr:ATP-binding protein [Streptomyces rubradiris]GHH25807.1 histidine kinase [Streptomyces rubradiris]GHI52745.1 histidine kinase [Streptomyces rubradiris]
MVPLLLLAVLVVAGLVVWRTNIWPHSLVLAGVGCGLAAVAFIAVREVRTAVGVVDGAVLKAREEDLRRLGDAVAAVETTLSWAADELCRGVRPPLPAVPEALPDGPTAAVEAVLRKLQRLIVEALLRVNDESGSVVLLDVLRALAKREHALVTRTLAAVSDLGMATDDPDLLSYIWKIDHLATRLRRQVESTAVLGGRSLRDSRQPLNVETVLRGAASEVVQYARVSHVAGSLGAELGLPGHVALNLMHLVAELIENSCENSDPATKVVVRAQRVAAGLAVEVEDRGVGMRPEVRDRMNQLLAAPDEADVSGQVRAGQIGLLVAAKIAQRHECSVMLQTNATGGTTALVVVPARLLVRMPPAHKPTPPQHRPHPVDASSQTSTVQAAARAVEGEQPRPGGESQLPRRRRAHGALRAPGGQRPAPTAGATPTLAAAFLDGSRRGGLPERPEPEQP